MFYFPDYNIYLITYKSINIYIHFKYRAAKAQRNNNSASQRLSVRSLKAVFQQRTHYLQYKIQVFFQK